MTELDKLDDIIWLMITAAMVFMMQGGFALLESGFVRAKNSANVAIKNFIDFCISSAIFWVFGFALMFGSTINGWLGSSGFFFNSAGDPWLMAFFIFQLVFCGAATTIISGAVAERMRFSGYLIVCLIVSGLIYPVVGHWMWGGFATGTATGWLVRMGFVDFAGSTVVHSVGGWVALAAVLVVGPRNGRFSGNKTFDQGNSLPMATLGALLLWFGWLGFNAGSTLALTDRVPFIVVNTVLGGAAGGFIALLLSRYTHHRFNVGVLINGTLAGLVSVTASAHAITPFSAIIISMIGGALSVAATQLLEKWEIDDAVGAVPVHAVGGVWGTLAVALFGNLEQLATGLTRLQQLMIQITGIFAAFVWAFGLGIVLLWLLNRVWALRVDPETEEMGLNMAEHGLSTEVLELPRGIELQQPSIF